MIDIPQEHLSLRFSLIIPLAGIINGNLSRHKISTQQTQLWSPFHGNLEDISKTNIRTNENKKWKYPQKQIQFNFLRLI